jgi:hypothetical protein
MRPLGWSLLAFLLVAPATANALPLHPTQVPLAPSWRDRAAAQKLAREAKLLMLKGSFEEAAAKYQEADKLVPAPSYKLERARALVELGRMLEAREVLRTAAEDKPAQFMEKMAQKKASAFDKELEQRTPTLEITVFRPEAAKVTLRIDGETIDHGAGAVPFDPGELTISAEAPGFAPWEQKVKLADGDRKTVEISMTPKAKPKAPEEEEKESDGISPIPAYVTWAVSAAALGVGIGFGVVAMQSTNSLLEDYDCEDNVCPSEAEEDLAIVKLQGNISTAGFAVGGAGVAIGLVLFLFSDAASGGDGDDPAADDASAVELSPVVAPGGAGVLGRF